VIGLFRNAGLAGKELGIEFGEGLAELVEFFGRTVEFEAEELGKGEGFLDTRSDVFEVLEDSGSADVGLAAKDNVAIHRKVIIEAGVLGAGAGHEFLHRFLEGIEFTFLDSEVGMNADSLGNFAHGESVKSGGERVKGEFTGLGL
jgi:hypothetical protein